MVDHDPVPAREKRGTSAVHTSTRVLDLARMAATLGEYPLAGALLAIGDGCLSELVLVHTRRHWLTGLTYRRGTAYVAVPIDRIVALADDVRASKTSTAGNEYASEAEAINDLFRD